LASKTLDKHVATKTIGTTNELHDLTFNKAAMSNNAFKRLPQRLQTIF